LFLEIVSLKIDMYRARPLCLVCCLLLIAAHRLPAPIVEPEEKPASIPRKPKSKTLSNSKGKISTVKAPASKTASIADHGIRVVLSENTRTSLMRLRTYVETVEKIPFAPKSDVQPDEILTRLRQVLSTRFRNVSISEGPGNYSANGPTVVFDVQAQAGMTSGETNSVVLSATFKDGTGHVLDTITGSGATKVPYPAWRSHFPEAVAAAFSEFSQKLSTRKL
jgi:hypothetical protein